MPFSLSTEQLPSPKADCIEVFHGQELSVGRRLGLRREAAELQTRAVRHKHGMRRSEHLNTDVDEILFSYVGGIYFDRNARDCGRGGIIEGCARHST